MCDQCKETPDPDKADSSSVSLPRLARGSRFSLSRRSFLAIGATMGGAAAGLWSCQQEPAARSVGDAPASVAQPPRTVAGAATAQTDAAIVATKNDAATQFVAAPDLGSELFPDALGHAIAKASDVPVIVIPRTDWTEVRPNLSQIQVMNGIDKITVHHTAMEMLTDAWRPTAGELETIREFHAGTAPTDRQWADIAYHFVIDRAGRVWQARPLAYQGAHVRGHNEHNLGIVLLGNFNVQSPAAAQLWSLAGFIGFVRNLYAVPLNQIFTHGELGQTECPGRLLQEYMNRTRRAWAASEGTFWNPISLRAG